MKKTLQPLFSLGKGIISLLIGNLLFYSSSVCFAADAPNFITFETGQVRPIALSPDGRSLFVVNTPDNRLEIFDISEDVPTIVASVVVGLEPVAIAVRSANEVWVVNHLSDSVSIVDVSTHAPRVTRTLLVGDEPRDIIFAKNDRAFITTARRGQHRNHPSLRGVPGAGDPQLSTPSLPRADIWVFDANNLGDELGGRPLKIVELFGDTPRALALSPNGTTVYAAIMFSGNQTTVVNVGTTCPNGEAPCDIKGELIPGDIAGPKTNAENQQAPRAGVIVKYSQNNRRFEDPRGLDYSEVVKLSLPDKDVFAINSETLEEEQSFQHVGTTLFNMVSNPVSGNLYISNFEANNFTLFEGPGDFGESTVQGHLAEARITVIDAQGVHPRHLNKHINYGMTPAPAGVKRHSLSMPLDMAVSTDGRLLAVAAFGSSKVGVFSTEELENDTFNPTVASRNYISVSGGGPSGLVLDEARNRLYVLTRFDNAVSVVDMQSRTELHHVALFNPEPSSVVNGRPFLYDANLTSSNGEASCGSCHIFGDLDNLAWNLGNPDDEVTKIPGRIFLRAAQGLIGELAGFAVEDINGTGEVDDFHPMKGPMTTQTLRGMKNHGAMHWRGDRATGFFGTDRRRRPPFDSELSFNNFIVAFPGLLGRQNLIDERDMQAFTDFALQIILPPNPVRALDNSLTRAQARGREFYMGCDGPGLIICNQEGQPVVGEHRSDGVPFVPALGFTCEGCHTLDPKRGFFGTDGKMSFDAVPQIMKVPHIRNVYTKVGMFGTPKARAVNDKDNDFKGDQVRGFGVFHDGGLDTVVRFMNGTIFNADYNDRVGFFGDDPQRQDIQEFSFAFDSDLPPITGQQVTLTGEGTPDINQRIDLLIARARAPFESEILGGDAQECDLVVKGVINGQPRGWLYTTRRRQFESDMASEDALSEQGLRDIAKVEGQDLTFTCVPYGSGERIGLDRDLDGVLDGDE